MFKRGLKPAFKPSGKDRSAVFRGKAGIRQGRNENRMDDNLRGSGGLSENQQPKKRLTPEQRKERAKLKAKKKRQKRLILASPLIFLTVVGILLALSLTVFFGISDYEIEGDTPYSAEEIWTGSGIERGQNLIRFKAEEAEKKLPEQLAYIESVEIIKKFPNKLIFKISGAKAVAAFEYREEWYAVDKNAKILEKTNEKAEQLALLSMPLPKAAIVGKPIEFEPAETEEDDILAICKSMLSEMAECEIEDITHVDLSDPKNVSMTYQSRIILKLGSPYQLKSRLEWGKKVIDEENKISTTQRGEINLTVPKKAYFKPTA